MSLAVTFHPPVLLLDDGQVSVRKGSWYDIFPEEQRLSWAEWYEGMHAHYGYDGYQTMAAALRDLSAP